MQFATKGLALVTCLLIAEAALPEAVRLSDMSAAELMDAERALRANARPAEIEQPRFIRELPVEAEAADQLSHSVTIRKDREAGMDRNSAKVRAAGSVRQYLDEVIAIDLVDQPFETILQSVTPLGWNARVQVKRPGFSEKVFSITAENRRGEVLATIQRATGVRFNLYPSLYLVLVTD